MIVLFHPSINKEKILENVEKVLNERMIGEGSVVSDFEQKVGEYLCGVYSGKQAKTVAVNSCTAALHLSYILAGVKAGDEVIVTPLSCLATSEPILYLGAKPVFADIQKDTLNIDPSSIECKITKKTKAIVVMHNGGMPCDMDEIMDIAKRHNLKVIEDTAQAFGGEYKGKKLGDIADYGCLSFQSIKMITSIDGGMLICKDEKDYKRAQNLRWFGIDRTKQRERKSLIPTGFDELFDQRATTFDVDEYGYKYHMNNVTASIGLANMEKIYEYLDYRKKLTKLYREELKDVNGITLLRDDPGNACWLFQVLVEDRKKLQEELGKRGIEANMVQIRNDIYKIMGGKRQNLPVMNELEGSYLSLPLHHYVTEEDVRFICNNIKEIMNPFYNLP